MDNFEEYEKEMIAIETEEFLGEDGYEPDLAEERNKNRAKVRSRRKKGRAKKKDTYLTKEDALTFRISKKIRELQEELCSLETLSPNQEARILNQLNLLYTTIENILSVSSDKRKLRKLIIKCKKIV